MNSPEDAKTQESLEDFYKRKQREYEDSGKKRAAEQIHEKLLRGEKVKLPFIHWKDSLVDIVGSYKNSKFSVLTGTDIWFEWDAGHGQIHQSHAINFDVLNPVFE